MDDDLKKRMWICPNWPHVISSKIADHHVEYIIAPDIPQDDLKVVYEAIYSDVGDEEIIEQSCYEVLLSGKDIKTLTKLLEAVCDES